MGVRPPADDDLDEPDVIEFGIAALDARLERLDLTYPLDAQTLRRNHGDMEIPFDARGQTVTLADALERVDHRTFDSEQDLLNTMHPVFEDLRESSSSGLLGQLRSLVPF